MIVGQHIDLQTRAVVKNALVLESVGSVQILTFAKNHFICAIDNWGAVKKAMSEACLITKTIALGKQIAIQKTKEKAIKN